ncbi:hypothetical protein pmac_cds_625 [Pandoravirus macleodensis]|uniref:Uncharacterized protein n=1 Tax=Pandoravirus macleodensis TaxID=2107707 RepID=A0A2U7UFQ5_9VIRU|nr:hypothetical protein pmac_cds_625 [Pandoravirus macleodensis]AVK77313.1 hypothetical protein pmac_cds_625 [Pandoravirus macleodensis]
MDTRPCSDQSARDQCLLLAAHIATANEHARNALVTAAQRRHEHDRHQTNTGLDEDTGAEASDCQTIVGGDVSTVVDTSGDVSVDQPDSNVGHGQVAFSDIHDRQQQPQQQQPCSPEPSHQDTDNAESDTPPSDEALLIGSLLEKCPQGTQRHLSAWASTIKAFVDTLPTQGEPLWYDESNEQHPTHSSATAAAALVRFLPALEAHGLDSVYSVVLRPEHVDDISGPWDAMNPLAEAYCGLGPWIVHVECGRKWYDDVRDGQELAGGVIAIRHIVHRQTHVHVAARHATLGEGYNATTQDYFAFMRSGCATPDAFVDATYGHVRHIPRVLSTSFGWTIAPGQPVDHRPFDTRRRSIDSLRDCYSLFFRRVSDGVTVCVGTCDRAILIGRSKIDTPDLAPIVSLFEPPLNKSGQQQQPQQCDVARDNEPRPHKVPRPHADYTNADPKHKRMRKTARARMHADRDYLASCGLLHPMHLALGNCFGGSPNWPCVGFRLAAHRPGDSRDEDDWYRCLTTRMDEVADLIRADLFGVFAFDIDDEVRDAVAAASHRLQDIARSLLSSTRRHINAEMLDAMVDNMLSPIVLCPWRIFRPDKYVTRGSRFVDPTRGLYINWRFRCNFVPHDTADGLGHTRFYGHILVVAAKDQTAGDRGVVGDARSCPVIVAGYYALTVREPRSTDTYGRFDDIDQRSSEFFDMNHHERAVVDDALAAADVSMETRFGSDEPHHVIAHYREREFTPIPKERFRGILDEDAMRIDGTENAGARIIRVFDWLQTAFDRHASIFGVPH